MLTDLDRRNIALLKLHGSNSYPEFKLCFLAYECQICMKYIFEVRVLVVLEYP